MLTLPVLVDDALTLPLTLMFCIEAPVEVQVILPFGEPLALLFIRIYIVVVFTIPDVWGKFTLFPNPEPELVDTSKPVGAVTIKLAVNPIPLTVKLC